MENHMEVSQKFESRIIMWSNCSTSVYLSKENKILKAIFTLMLIVVLCTMIKILKQLVSIYRGIDKEDMVCVCNGYISLQKGNLAISSNMGGSGQYCAKWSKSEKEKYCKISLICRI